MKQKLLLLIALFCFLTGNAQSPSNDPRTAHDSLSCDDDLINPSCNLIVNPAFRSTGDSLEDFSDGDVFMWQDINNLTSDINGALANGMGWNLPAVPLMLSGANYASMLLDNSGNVTEGISGRTFPLEKGKKYALSFFLSSSALGSYRTYGGSLSLKYFLPIARILVYQRQRIRV